MSLSMLTLIPCLIVATASPQPPATGILKGLVTDAQGAPLQGVTVTVTSTVLPSNRVVVTDASGTFSLPLLPFGTYQVTLSKSGMASVRVSLQVTRETNQHQFRMTFEAAACVEVVATSPSLDFTSCMSATNFSRNQMSLAPGIDSQAAVRRLSAPGNTETYRKIEKNPFKTVRREPLSTFSIDVDTASYSNVRRFLDMGQKPPKDSVRIEELLNYFTYAYPAPEGDQPFAVATEVLECPWQPSHRLVRVGLQARRLELAQLPPRNLVFLIDVSGSMASENRLPLVKKGLARLCDSLRPQDRVALVVYAGSSGLVLEPTSGTDKERIKAALGRLEAGGSTHGSAGIQQAYEVARRHFQKDADNRVLLCTDGDFNVGTSDEGSLVRLIESERKSGVFLTCLGFGMGNLRDATLEQLADKGNGNYGYIDSLKEMEKVFGAGGASLVTLAKDVKLQVEFNPAKVKGYRLIGYENRLLEAEDFNDDGKDAGEINAGHSVTALYEIVPPEAPMDFSPVDRLRYQTEAKPQGSASGDLLTVKVRYKRPDGFFSRRLEFPVRNEVLPFAKASEDSRWATAVAAFGMVLRDAPAKGTATLGMVATLASGARGTDPSGYRMEFLRLIGTAQELTSATKN